VLIYRGEDIRLERPVALKFLPEHISSSDEDRERFLQEARAASAINHTNISFWINGCGCSNSVGIWNYTINFILVYCVWKTQE